MGDDAERLAGRAAGIVGRILPIKIRGAVLTKWRFIRSVGHHDSSHFIRILLFSGALCLPASYSSGNQMRRGWAVSDSTAVRYFVTSKQGAIGYWSSAAESPARVSPDGRHFFVAMYHGDLVANEVICELNVYSVAAVQEALRHDSHALARSVQPLRKIAVRGGNSSSGPIQSPQWIDASSIAYRVIRNRASGSLQTFNIETGLARSWSDERHDLQHYSLAGGSIVYAARERAGEHLAESDVPIRVHEGNWYFLDSVTPKEHWRYPFYVSFHGAPLHRVAVARDLKARAASANFGAWVSSDGRWAIAEYEPQDILAPAAWRAYWGLRGDVGLLNRRTRFILIDLARGTAAPVFDAPTGLAVSTFSNVLGAAPYGVNLTPRALWAADSRHVVLVNTALPLNGDEERRFGGYVVDFDLGTRTWAIIEPLADAANNVRVRQVGWLALGKELLITHRDFSADSSKIENAAGIPAPGALYTLVDGRWVGKQVPASVDLPSAYVPEEQGHEEAALPDLEIAVKESANDPPVLVAQANGHEVALTDSDPVLKAIWRARADVVEWPEADGKTGRGLLMLPRHFSRVSPPPLVMQTYQFLPQFFRPDGHAATGYAAQALVAKGIAVLQTAIALEDPQGKSVGGTPEEGPFIVNRMDSAVAFLGANGLVDPGRVGLIGFSRGGFNVYYAITNPGVTKISAAIVADAARMSLSEYILLGIGSKGSDGKAEIERMYGGGSFWNNKASWIQHAADLNADRVRGATLFVYNNRAGIDAVVETLGAFHLNRRPVEFLLFPDGAHQLQRPRERYESLSATVNWFDFWMQGKEDVAQSKHERYSRWRQMRADWQATQLAQTGAHKQREP